MNDLFKLNIGENGTAVDLEDEFTVVDEIRYSRGWDSYGFNEYASNLVSLNRSLPDYRDESCKLASWLTRLPRVSIIITYYNEALSTLLRTVRTVLDRSDPAILAEIILVDDCSSFSKIWILRIALFQR